MKTCTKCHLEKDEMDFNKGKARCKICTAEYQTQYRQKNIIQILEREQIYRDTHKIEIKEYNDSHKEEKAIWGKINYEEHKEEKSAYSKQYNEKNKDTIRTRQTIYQKDRYNNDLLYRLKRNISNLIWKRLNRTGGTKNGESCLKNLNYSLGELKSHIEQQFSLPNNEWMTWENQGIYNSTTWNDLDPTTWTWQLDHILPHSDFHYTSMEDQAFKDCWALSNLRPLKAKQNVIEGTNRLRHKNET